MRGLIIRREPLELILASRKTWELRSHNTKVHGRIGLIMAGTGMVYGTAEIIGSFPVGSELLSVNQAKHCVSTEWCEKYRRQHGQIYAWILRRVKRFKKPIPYKHPSGAVIWVNIPDVSEIG